MTAPSPELLIRLEVLPGATVAEQIQNAADFGFQAIALPGRFIDRWLGGLRECRADLALPIASISLGFEHSLLSPSADQRAKCRESLVRLFDLCAEFGAGLFNLPPCLIQDNPKRIHDPNEIETLLLEQLPEVADEAKARGVVLLLEPVNKYESETINSVVEAAEISQKCNHSHLGITADFFHMQLEELHSAEALARALPQVRHVHVAENTRVEPGSGSLDFHEGFGVLKNGDYKGLIEVECRSLSGPAAEVLPASAAHLRNVWSCAA
ncbi:MAG: sugar phosphate isomerase/epimerase family protein [Verrucomicrobiota bacterium]